MAYLAAAEEINTRVELQEEYKPFIHSGKSIFKVKFWISGS